MKKVFWCIQQVDHLGGTEMVSINLMNMLCEYYEIHMIVISKLEGENCYNINPKIHLHYLNIPSSLGRFDQSWFKAKKEPHKFKTRISLINGYYSHYFHKRRYYQHLIESLMDKDSIYIGSCKEAYLLAPSNCIKYYHWHFAAKEFLSLSNTFYINQANTPDKFIFLNKTTLDEVTRKRKELKNISTYIYNPIKFEPYKQTSYHQNRLLFIGRYAYQKNPFLALEIAKILHDNTFPFSLQMYGEGEYYNKMKEFVKENNLLEVSIDNSHKVNVEDYRNADLLLLTSNYEGFPLVIGEANSQSLPVISSYWGKQIEELFVEGQNGVIIHSFKPQEYADKIMELLNDKNKLIAYKEAAHDSINKFSKESIISFWRELLD